MHRGCFCNRFFRSQKPYPTESFSSSSHTCRTRSFQAPGGMVSRSTSRGTLVGWQGSATRITRHSSTWTRSRSPGGLRPSRTLPNSDVEADVPRTLTPVLGRPVHRYPVARTGDEGRARSPRAVRPESAARSAKRIRLGMSKRNRRDRVERQGWRRSDRAGTLGGGAVRHLRLHRKGTQHSTARQLDETQNCGNLFTRSCETG
jgi:hypothetical protein